MNRILGFDLGSKTLGISISDPLGMIARALTTLRFESDDYEKAFSSLEQLYKTRKRLENTIKENDARVVQLGFDAEMEQWRQGKIFAYIIMVVLSLAIFFLCLWLKSCIRFSKEHRKVMEGELLIRDYREKLAKLPKDDQEKRSRYEEKLAMVTKEQAQRLSNGVKLYEEMFAKMQFIICTRYKS